MFAQSLFHVWLLFNIWFFSPGQQSPLSLKCHAKVRNEYLRTVLSPHGKTFSPSSGTPSGKNYSNSPVVSPVLKTPIRDANFTSSSQFTPQGTTPPSWTNSTYNRTANPFESAHSHTDLHLPTFLSPGIFTVSSTPSPAGVIVSCLYWVCFIMLYVQFVDSQPIALPYKLV